MRSSYKKDNCYYYYYCCLNFSLFSLAALWISSLLLVLDSFPYLFSLSYVHQPRAVASVPRRYWHFLPFNEAFLFSSRYFKSPPLDQYLLLIRVYPTVYGNIITIITRHTCALTGKHPYFQSLINSNRKVDFASWLNIGVEITQAEVNPSMELAMSRSKTRYTYNQSLTLFSTPTGGKTA